MHSFFKRDFKATLTTKNANVRMTRQECTGCAYMRGSYNHGTVMFYSGKFCSLIRKRNIIVTIRTTWISLFLLDYDSYEPPMDECNCCQRSQLRDDGGRNNFWYHMQGQLFTFILSGADFQCADSRKLGTRTKRFYRTDDACICFICDHLALLTAKLAANRSLAWWAAKGWEVCLPL